LIQTKGFVPVSGLRMPDPTPSLSEISDRRASRPVRGSAASHHDFGPPPFATAKPPPCGPQVPIKAPPSRQTAPSGHAASSQAAAQSAAQLPVKVR
jgi:hypothetical protein